MPRLIESSQWLWRRFLKCRQYIFPISDHDPSFAQTLIIDTQGCLVPNLVEIGGVVLKKKMKKSLQTEGRQTTGNQKVSFEFLTQVS